MTLTIEDLKAQRRWVLWRLETVHEKQTKVRNAKELWERAAHE